MFQISAKFAMSAILPLFKCIDDFLLQTLDVLYKNEITKIRPILSFLHLFLMPYKNKPFYDILSVFQIMIYH